MYTLKIVNNVNEYHIKVINTNLDEITMQEIPNSCKLHLGIGLISK